MPAQVLLLLGILSRNNALRVPPSSADGYRISYFAYGSNLATSVREGRRRLRPISTMTGFVRDERLAFNMPGFSLLEPSFASISPANGQECHGAVFELSLADWAKLCLSEGVPWGYRVREVQVELYTGEMVRAWTLSAGALSSPVDIPPSERYLSLIRLGAQELGLTRAWQEQISKIPTAPLSSPGVKVSESYERREGATFV